MKTTILTNLLEHKNNNIKHTEKGFIKDIAWVEIFHVSVQIDQSKKPNQNNQPN